MDKFLKRRAGYDADSSKFGKRARPLIEWGCEEPKTIVVRSSFSHRRWIPVHYCNAWNCNGLTARIRARDTEELRKFMDEVKPDVLFLSEVRVAAANNAASRKPGPHTKWFRNRMKDNDKKSGEDAAGVNSLLRTDEFNPFKTYFSLSNSKYAGTTLLIRKDAVQKPRFIRYNLENEDVNADLHDVDGRVIFVGFAGFSILHTYVPNNGWGESHFARRKAWDDKILQFVKRQRLAGENLMWIGDLNVAPKDSDLSHPADYRRQIGEELRIKSKESGIPVEQCNIGQPGCTDAERNRFKNILEAGDLVDAYRKLSGESCDSDYAYSWRGAIIGKHGGRGMRIDHCIASTQLMSRIRAVKITGHGAQRAGFMGSDHSPVLIQLSAGNTEAPDVLPKQ